ncbi:Cytochrome c-552 precursor [Limihaloglobus sulfuriphilus]|uniref:nitrite reductase (cytochrome; ammonia-forming) n=1 Tax=Limihaloglobus sulfuriphilus TaxID=1851148 RepID=A0A1Q2MC47_9BACT|nr:ammonia-forming cytochrome c nitrite reductase subunit c552 [Limihaloglobus sulfuriphilus]AQQ70244.1 Cytochrome c-552 precursor [Limihaloglobus sulfuriphilus]
MTNNENGKKETNPQLKLPLWAGLVILAMCAAVVLLLGLLAVSIMERRWEAQRPGLVLKPIDEWQPDNAVWGQNYPNEYDTYLKTRIDDTKTKYGGAYPRDYLEEDPMQVILFAGYGFSKEYLQARGHYHAVTDVKQTERIKTPYNPGTCLTCKSTDVPRLMDKMGVAQFYAANFHDIKEQVQFPIGCQDCHDPKTMSLRITRPALQEGFESMNKDINEASHQEMRSLVCAQCHVEYYFSREPKEYLTFPWKKGTKVEEVIEYYDELEFTDYVHPISKTNIIKAQHPDYELYMTGVHSYIGVSCADCHMPYHSQGGMKLTDHHIQSPLLNIANSCAVCHRWSEEQIRDRVEGIQDKVQTAMLDAEDAIVKAHFDVRAAIDAGVTDEKLAPARKLIRHAQYRWDYISASNGMGFHSPQECMRVLGDSANQAQQSRLIVARLLAEKGIASETQYPDYSTREKAVQVISLYE